MGQKSCKTLFTCSSLWESRFPADTGWRFDLYTSSYRLWNQRSKHKGNPAMSETLFFFPLLHTQCLPINYFGWDLILLINAFMKSSLRLQIPGWCSCRLRESLEIKGSCLSSWLYNYYILLYKLLLLYIISYMESQLFLSKSLDMGNLFKMRENRRKYLKSKSEITDMRSSRRLLPGLRRASMFLKHGVPCCPFSASQWRALCKSPLLLSLFLDTCYQENPGLLLNCPIPEQENPPDFWGEEGK